MRKSNFWTLETDTIKGWDVLVKGRRGEGHFSIWFSRASCTVRVKGLFTLDPFHRGVDDWSTDFKRSFSLKEIQVALIVMTKAALFVVQTTRKYFLFNKLFDCGGDPLTWKLSRPKILWYRCCSFILLLCSLQYNCQPIATDNIMYVVKQFLDHATANQ